MPRPNIFLERSRFFYFGIAGDVLQIPSAPILHTHGSSFSISVAKTELPSSLVHSRRFYEQEALVLLRFKKIIDAEVC